VDDKRRQKATLTGGTVVCVSTYAACLIDVFDTVVSVDFAQRASSLADLAGVDADAFTAAVTPWDEAVTIGSSTIRSVVKEVLRNLGSDVNDERLDRLVAADVQLLRDLSGVLRTQSLSSRRCTRRVSGRRS
jgi:hypothetical protein